MKRKSNTAEQFVKQNIRCDNNLVKAKTKTNSRSTKCIWRKKLKSSPEVAFVLASAWSHCHIKTGIGRHPCLHSDTPAIIAVTKTIQRKPNRKHQDRSTHRNKHADIEVMNTKQQQNSSILKTEHTVLYSKKTIQTEYSMISKEPTELHKNKQ